MSRTLTCRVVSPERPLFEGAVDRLVAPGAKGELGIYPLHAPLISKLGPGVVRLHEGQKVTRLAIRDGFLEVKDDAVTLLVSRAVTPADVDRATAERELAETVEELRHPGSDERFRELLEQRRWLEVCVRMHG